MQAGKQSSINGHLRPIKYVAQRSVKDTKQALNSLQWGVVASWLLEVDVKRIFNKYIRENFIKKNLLSEFWKIYGI